MRLRTGYSFRSAVGRIEEALERVDTPWAPITDRGSTFGFTKWNKACVSAGKRPLFGVEIAVSPEPTAKKVTRSYWTFIATSSIAPINKIVAKATEQFRYEPLLSYTDLNWLPDGLLVFPGRSAIPELINPKLAGLHVFNSPGMPDRLLDWAREKELPFVASSDNYYPAPDDRKLYEIICGYGASTQTFPMHILSEAELELHCGREAMATAERLAASCSVELLPASLLKPEHPATLAEMCVEGAKRLGCDLERPEYAERLEKELRLIKEKNFEDYFYIIADLVDAAKKRMFVGPARGSSCGSLVCYLLGITTIDPIPFDLIFERFIDINRKDLPDIDIDFSDQRRHLVFKHLEERYGRERVARLGTVSLYKPKSAINETAAALGVPKWRTAQFTGSIIDRSSGDARALQAIEDTFKDTETGRKLLSDFPELKLAERLEGHPRHYGQHAAGVIVTERPVEEYVAIDIRANSTHCDKKDAEALNLLKIDCLGLTQLSILEDCLEMIGWSREKLMDYPLDDPKAFAVLNERRWSGIFQFNGSALQSIAQQVQITELEDIIAITALARPGPMASGGTQQWIERKNGRAPVTYLHPLFEDILSASLGIVVYQEQVMRVVREIGGFSWEDTSRIRKVMSDRKGAETFAREEAKFVKGATANGLSSDLSKEVWKALSQYGSWAFNRSHSVAYGFISYWCCVLKAYHPLEFAAATLTHISNDEDGIVKQLKMLREMVKEGYTYTPVDAKASTDKWVASNGRLIGPLTNIKGLGPKLLSEIMAAKASGAPLPKRAEKLLADPVTPIDDLEPVTNRIKALYPDGLETLNILTEPTPLEQCTCEGMGGRTVLVVCKVVDINPRNLNEPQLVAKRDGRMIDEDKADFLNLVIEDDTDQMRATIWARKWDTCAKPIIERGDGGNVLYALKGVMGDGDFRAIDVDRIKFLGSLKA
jgi:DNA polymerase III alpha subunit